MLHTFHYWKLKVLLLLTILSGQLFVSAQQLKKAANVSAASTKAFYKNPVLGGDYPDPSLLSDGKDYYMTHSSFEYYPGLLIWHSTDLINITATKKTFKPWAAKP